MALLTLQEVQEWLPQASGNERLLQQAIDRAEARAARFCNRKGTFDSAARDHYFTVPQGVRVIQLPSYPVTAVTTVTENAQETTTSEVASTGYILDADAGLLYRDGTSWATGFEQVRVQYTAGYSASTLPDDLRDAMLDLVGWLLDRRGDRGVKQDSVDGASETREAMIRGVPESIASSLQDYVLLETV
jgi:hypothetical protein